MWIICAQILTEATDWLCPAKLASLVDLLVVSYIGVRNILPSPSLSRYYLEHLLGSSTLLLVLLLSLTLSVHLRRGAWNPLVFRTSCGPIRSLLIVEEAVKRTFWLAVRQVTGSPGLIASLPLGKGTGFSQSGFERTGGRPVWLQKEVISRV